MICLTPCIQGFFLYFLNEIHACEQHYGKTDVRIFVKFLGKCGHEIRNNVEHFWDLTTNPLNMGLIFLFSRSVFVRNIMENG